MDEVRKEENRFIVLKREKVDAYFMEAELYRPVEDRGDAYLSKEAREQRQKDLEAFKRILDDAGTSHRYIICNQDEPYAEKVWQTILEGEKNKIKKKKKDPEG
jgi:hypothetical protein